MYSYQHTTHPSNTYLFFQGHMGSLYNYVVMSIFAYMVVKDQSHYSLIPSGLSIFHKLMFSKYKTAASIHPKLLTVCQQRAVLWWATIDVLKILLDYSHRMLNRKKYI